MVHCYFLLIALFELSLKAIIPVRQTNPKSKIWFGRNKLGFFMLTPHIILN
jgi:hypothetical protein